MESLMTLLRKIQDERFIHYISELTYDRIFTLWHLSPEVEKQLSALLSKTVMGLFFIRYLSHINDLLIEKAQIKERLTSEDLVNNNKLKELEEKLKDYKNDTENLLKEYILPLLNEIMEETRVTTLTDFVKLAHSGDYLSTALDEMKERNDPDYILWLEAVPEYYNDDLIHMGLKRKKSKKGMLLLDKWVSNMNQHMPTDSFMHNGKTYSLRPLKRERRRPLCGFSRWTRRSIDHKVS